MSLITSQKACQLPPPKGKGILPAKTMKITDTDPPKLTNLTIASLKR